MIFLSSLATHFRSIETANIKSQRIQLSDFKKLTEREATLFLRFGCFYCPGASTAGFRFCVGRHQEFGANQRSTPSNVMYVTVLEVAGNCSVVLEINLRGPGWTTTKMRISHYRYVEKVFENSTEISSPVHSMRRPTY